MGKERNEAGPGEGRLGNHAQLLSSPPTEALTKVEPGQAAGLQRFLPPMRLSELLDGLKHGQKSRGPLNSACFHSSHS